MRSYDVPQRVVAALTPFTQSRVFSSEAWAAADGLCDDS